MNRTQKLFLLALVLIAGISVDQLNAQETDASTETKEVTQEKAVLSPPATANAIVGEAEVSINYGAPSVRERAIWGELVPYGEVWRTGANDATTVTVSNDILVEGQALPAGTYSLFTIPNEGQWTIIFNSVSKQWGHYDYDESKDILRVEVTPQMTDDMVETLVFDFTEGDGNTMINLKWENLHVPIAISPAAN